MGKIIDWKVSDDFGKWVKKAETGDIEAQYSVARHIIHELKPDKDEKELIDKAVEYFRNAAMSGYFGGIAAEELGELYYDGQFIKQDYSQAVLWFRTSLNQLMPIGYFMLGHCFYNGHGVEQDFAKAFDTYFKGAKTAYINNEIKLADMYKNGEFADRDATFAVKLYQRVCDLTVLEYKQYHLWSDSYGLVCLRLGAAYLYGVGVAKDIDQANSFFSEAKKQTTISGWANRYVLDTETQKLLNLLDRAPYPKDFQEDAPETAAVSAASRVGGELAADLTAYDNIVRVLLMEPNKHPDLYEKLVDIYPRLTCFEKDDGFLEFCRKKASNTK